MNISEMSCGFLFFLKKYLIVFFFQLVLYFSPFLGAVVTITAPVNMNVDSLQSLSSDGTTLAVQQVMMAGQSEDESADSTEDDGTDLSTTNISGLVLDNSDSLQ